MHLAHVDEGYLPAIFHAHRERNLRAVGAEVGMRMARVSFGSRHPAQVGEAARRDLEHHNALHRAAAVICPAGPGVAGDPLAVRADCEVTGAAVGVVVDRANGRGCRNPPGRLRACMGI